jgi:hypothetical protein
MSEVKSDVTTFDDAACQRVERDIWTWIHDFVTAKSEFYDYKFAPCPYARQAVQSRTVDVRVWRSGDVRQFIRNNATQMRDCPAITTRVMAFPPQVRYHWGINDFVESLNAQLIPANVFLNTGVAKTTRSKFPGSAAEPYFIVIANSLDAVLAGAEALTRTDYYKDWPAAHYALVVERRARMAQRYGRRRDD